MNNWFAKNLGDAMLAGESLAQIEEKFQAMYVLTGNSADKAVFIRHQSEGQLHCEVWVFFSPATVELAKEVAADLCQRPSADTLGLLLGSEDCWKVCFPDR